MGQPYWSPRKTFLDEGRVLDRDRLVQAELVADLRDLLRGLDLPPKVTAGSVDGITKKTT